MLKRSSDLGPLCQPVLHEKGRPGKTTMERTLLSVVVLTLMALADPNEAIANVFGQCAHQRDLETKIASCVQASKSTSYPWVLHWVYRESARAYRERGQIEKAITSYAQSLAAAERETVRQEMEELALLGSM